jgi:membrane dipeptidase
VGFVGGDADAGDLEAEGVAIGGEAVGIHIDVDGGFGTEQSPSDLDTIADLQTIPGLLSQRGYSAEDIEGIMSGNFLRVLRQAL